jgi:transcriptional regulator with XRE-family HTH domain
MKVVKYLRQEAGLSQRELAEYLGTAQPRIADWENGKTTMPLARRRDAAQLLRLRLPKLATRISAGALERRVRATWSSASDDE